MLGGNTVSITNKLYLAARLSLASSPESLEFALPTTYVLLDLSGSAGHELGRRAGTENILPDVGLGA
jgi:hypothetical protein